jgi:hypothetical protein
VKQNDQYSIYDVLMATHINQGVQGEIFDSSDSMLSYAVTMRNGDSAAMKAWPW